MHTHEKEHPYETEHQTPGFHGDGEREVIPDRKWHKDWRVWAVVLLLFVAIATYILTQGGLRSLIGSPGARATVSQAAAP